MSRFKVNSLAVAVFLAVIALSAPACGEEGQLQLTVVDKDTGEPVPCRIHLRSAAGKPVKIPGAISWADHTVIDGKLNLKLPLGGYTFTVERGLEYLDMTGHFKLDHFANDTKTIEIRRFCNLAKEGWWSGDVDVERRDKDLPLLMQAEDLHMVSLTTFTAAKSNWAKQPPPKAPLVEVDHERAFHLLCGADALPGGTLGYANLSAPLDLKALRESTSGSPLDHAAEARASGGVTIARSITDWDLPVWIALGRVDAVSLIDRQFGREVMLPPAATQRPYDHQRYPPPEGVARFAQQVYFNLLDCGLRVSPVAGSGNGVTTNPAGYGRTYVHCGAEFSYGAWWQGVHDGKTVVTNGPLLRPDVEGHPPGYVFELPAGEKKEIEIALTLSTRDKIAYLEIVKDGHVAHEVRLDAFAQAGGKLPKLQFDKSGWFLVRAVADNPKTYRFAMTAPYYVQIGDEPRISKKAAEFLVNWVKDRQANLMLPDPSQQAKAERELAQALEYWQAIAAKANAD